MPDDGSGILICLALCMYILIHYILQWMKHMAEIALYELQHDAHTDRSVSNIKWTADNQVQYLDCDEIYPIFFQ